MISKLIVWGKDREEAISRMIRAIDEYQITGIQSTLPFGKFVMCHEAFRTGNYDTQFVTKHFNSTKLQQEDAAEMKIAAFFTNFLFTQNTIKKQPQTISQTPSNWKRNRT
jgi:acetyl/propionyl-CoA carboxylase alpha subunit